MNNNKEKQHMSEYLSQSTSFSDYSGQFFCLTMWFEIETGFVWVCGCVSVCDIIFDFCNTPYLETFNDWYILYYIKAL